MEIITLYRDGDVYIAPGTPPLKQYLVSSAVLSNASPVFQAMFSNHFEEGQQLSTAAPKPVSLPEDDPRSVEILLYVMHYHPAAKDMETEEGAAFAQLCDKYGCVESMGSYMNSWLAATWEKYRYEFDEECKLCATAWYFGDAESFRSISSRLVLEHEDSFFKVASEGLYNVPIKLLYRLHEAREQVRKEIARAVTKVLDGVEESDCDMVFDLYASDVAWVLVDTDEVPVIPFAHHTAEWLRKLNPNRNRKGHLPAKPGYARQKLREIRDQGVEDVNAVVSNFKGLELDDL